LLLAMSPRLLLAFCLAAFASADEEEEGKSVLLLYKRMEPMSDFSVGESINVTLSIFNKGSGNAFSLVVNDDNWKSDKFRIVSGANNFTLDYLNAGDQYVHEFQVVPIKKTWHRIRPAKMAFIDGVEGESTIVHLSNTLPDIRIAPEKNALEQNLLLLGRIVTLNIMQTKDGWMRVGAVGIGLLVLQLLYIAKAVMQKRRHLRALEEVKKM